MPDPETLSTIPRKPQSLSNPGTRLSPIPQDLEGTLSVDPVAYLRTVLNLLLFSGEQIHWYLFGPFVLKGLLGSSKSSVGVTNTDPMRDAIRVAGLRARLGEMLYDSRRAVPEKECQS